MSDTPNLALPLIATGQSQKHVTHNDALARLDAIVQLAVIDRDLNAPPGSPTEGDCYLAAGSPTGAWAGHARKIFFYTSSGWARVDPGVGWTAFVIDEAVNVTWTGSSWDVVSGGVTELGSLNDVDLGGLADGDTLVWDEAAEEWVPAAPGGGSTTLAALTDVDLTGLADGDTLVWDDALDEWVPGDASGSVTLPSFSGARAGLSGDLTMSTTGAWTDIVWTTEERDTDGYWSSGSGARMTVPSGVTKVRLRANLWGDASDALPASNMFRIVKNGSSLVGLGGATVQMDGYNNPPISFGTDVVDVVAGDYFTVQYFLTSSGVLDVAQANWFSIEAIEHSFYTSDGHISINAQTGTSYTGVISDRGKMVTMDNASSNTFQLPLNSSVAYDGGDWIIVKRKGAGATTILAPSGGTLNGVTNGSCAISAQWNSVVLTKLAAGGDAWTIDGAHGVVS